MPQFKFSTAISAGRPCLVEKPTHSMLASNKLPPLPKRKYFGLKDKPSVSSGRYVRKVIADGQLTLFQAQSPSGLRIYQLAPTPGNW